MNSTKEPHAFRSMVPQFVFFAQRGPEAIGRQRQGRVIGIV
jgi:hypothetical protein